MNSPAFLIVLAVSAAAIIIHRDAQKSVPSTVVVCTDAQIQKREAILAVCLEKGGRAYPAACGRQAAYIVPCGDVGAPNVD